MEYSVLMSVYDKENPRYLKGAIESILAQTVKTNDFVIVCDGPLKPELLSVINEYKSRYPDIFNIVQLDKNVGLANALNKGIVLCKNEWVARMDSDDIAIRDRMERQLDAAGAHSADIVSGTVREFHGEYVSTEEVENSGTLGASRVLPAGQEDILKFAKKRSPFNHPAVMYKKSAVIEAGLYEDYRYFEDYNLWVNMLKAGCRGYNTEAPLVYMRAGSEMYRRRGGMTYVKCIYRFKRHLYKIGFISFGQFVADVTARSVVSLIPNGLRKFLYSKVLRK